MITFVQWQEELENKADQSDDEISDIRTELEFIKNRIQRSNAILSYTRDAELNDAKDLLLDLKEAAQELLDSVDNILTGRSFHV